MPKMQPISHVSAEYQQFLNSDLWQRARSACLTRDGGRCCLCGSTKNLQCHHTDYTRWWVPRGECLMILCDECHRVVTKYIKMCKLITSKQYVNSFDASFYGYDPELLSDFEDWQPTDNELQEMADIVYGISSN